MVLNAEFWLPDDEPLVGSVFVFSSIAAAAKFRISLGCRFFTRPYRREVPEQLI